MEDKQKMSKAFEFALYALDIYRKVMVLVVFWSFWAIFFSTLEPTFIANILLSAVAFGLAVMPLLVDFNESHATNPLWTGHARFHLVWQVNAMILSSLLSLYLLWITDDSLSLGLVYCIIYLWIIAFALTLFSMSLYDGELNDVNGVPPIKQKLFGKNIVIDRNVQAISGAFIVLSLIHI